MAKPAKEKRQRAVTPEERKAVVEKAKQFQQDCHPLLMNFISGLVSDIAKGTGIPAHFYWDAENWTTRTYFAHGVAPSEHPLRGG
jgi:hypothetical protein